MTSKVSLKRLMSLDYEPKMRWRTFGFAIILCKYGLLLEKPLSISMREMIWDVSFDLLLELDLYINVDDVVGYEPKWWRESVDHKFASWSEDLVGHVSQIYVVEWDISLLWALKKFT